MKIFIDTEFIEDGKTIDLLSLAAVKEDGSEFYTFNRNADLNKADNWLIYNVYPHLPVIFTGGSWEWQSSMPTSRWAIKETFRRFCGDKPEFWAYYADYDWLAVCQLFGKMVDLPSNWPKYCMDIKQYQVMLGDIELPKQESAKHDALYDARWTRDSYNFLANLDKYKAENGKLPQGIK